MNEAAERTAVRPTRSGSFVAWAARSDVMTVALVLLLALAAVVRILLTRKFPAPWIMGDVSSEA
jgi:hypothetical protein